MLTKEQNDYLTRVGPGTSAGNLLRRYWHPVALASDLTPESPTKFIRVLAEDLVLFQDKSGQVGLIQDHCPHRGASLLYGRVEDRGIACAYHGWLYDTRGNCLETPAEPADSKLYLTVKATAYPVQRFVGLYWAYLGPQPVPVIPKYDAWAAPGLKRKITVRPIDCNWLQAMENSMDPAHLQILHQDGGRETARNVANTTRGRTDEVAEFTFYEVPYGVMKRRTYKNGLLDEHPVIFPNILRHQGTQIRVPVDDEHFIHYSISAELPQDGEDTEAEPTASSGRPHKQPPDALHPAAHFTMADIPAQDYMAWETQGRTFDRSMERLATSDRGIAMFREVLRREIERVDQGQDPMGVIYDPNHEVIDTNLIPWLRHYYGWERSANRRPEPVGGRRGSR